ncbi:transglutaminase domain-containing protein [Pareuzebyella sediminis]|uniref:transglutaminase domain-containing protein n=1 Tax=Pareuzebyella sediminis TaxID=2607998 RepID=UPI0011EE52FD|nr:DUF3857 domain-containing protein [Pareuzebyella sediminis]
MRCAAVFLIFVFCNFSTISAQENQAVASYWQQLFNNQREDAISEFKLQKKNSLSHLLTHEVLKVENGVFSNPEGFINTISSYPDFEYYLYALWNQSFFFNTYLTSGFNGKSSKNIEDIDLERIKNTTVKESLRYLKSAVAQHHGDWNRYFELNAEVPSIKAWQYCGSFENLNGSGLATEYGPEKNPISKSDFNANSNGFINWYTPKGRNKEAYQYYSNHSEYGGSVNYAQTFVHNKVKRKAVLRLGSSSLLKVWVNDILVFENNNDGITDLDAYSVEINLPQGNNRLLVKSADKTGLAYFIVRLTDRAGLPLADLQYTERYSEYRNSSLAELSPEILTHPVESFFLRKMDEEPNNFFNTFCLLNTYLRNSKYTQAKALLQPFLKKYPNSSFLRKYLIECYTKEKDFTSAQELQKNIEQDDKRYFLSYVYRLQDTQKLFKLPVSEFEKFVHEFSESTDMDIMKTSAQLLLHLRKEDKTAVNRDLNRIISEHGDQLNILKIYLNLFSTYLNEDEKAIATLEDINTRYFDYGALKTLANFYDKQGKKDKVLALFEDSYAQIPYDNILLSDYISYLHHYKKYQESLPYLERFLANYPYSAVGMEYRGTALEQLNEKKEALKWFRKSLKHNGSNVVLRKKIDDLSNESDYFEEMATPDMYNFIVSNRGKDIPNHYGYNYLLEENLLQLYPEGGGKTRTRYVVEITSDGGIESLKEVNLGLNGNYHISKSEIVKPDKKIVPASRSGSNVVFNGLEIGDVIHIDYETNFTNSGRFYKDHVDYFQFDSYHPTAKNRLQVLVPKETPFHFAVLNGTIDHKETEKGDYVLHKWETVGNQGMSPQENYMPSLSDVAKYVHISTIESWDDIAKWYSDLVRPQMLVNSDVNEAYKAIFPNGASGYSEEEKASRIYYYIMENFSYSHVGFRQSGYVPQKPSTTIKSRLGDCKDFSTLYVTLTHMAGLKSHLVLVLTSDYGERSMVLPNQDFNHCIAKVFINGRAQYLELTDNNMPYRALPTSLESATALDIPNQWVGDVKKGVYKLSDIERTPTVLESHMSYILGENQHRLQIESILRGSINTHYASILKERNYEVIKKKLTEDFQGRITEDFTLDSIHGIEYDLRSPVIKYISDLTINEHIDKIGNMNVLRIPAVNNAYNNAIIADDDRTYPIDYLLYENTDIYRSSYVIKLRNNQHFVEVPESADYSFKEHRFHIEYVLSEANELHVKIEAHTSKERIAPEEYRAFKQYVKSVLDAKQQLIGFKRVEGSDEVLSGRK